MATNGHSPKHGTDVTYEDLISLEYEYQQAELEVMRLQNKLFSPLNAKLTTLSSKIPNFWALVFEQCPADMDQYIQPEDSKLFAEALLNVNVRRFEPDISPRSVEITMTFKKGNEWFEDEVLSKKFWCRRSGVEDTGLVSEPVRVRWRKGKDLTNGLTDMAFDLFQVRKEKGLLGEGGWDGAELEKSNEYRELAKKLEGNDPSQFSFFTFFGYVSDKRWVSAEESAAFDLKFKEAREKKLPKDAETNDAENEREQLEMDVEICPHGDDMATFIAEDIFPNAIRYFVSAQEQDEEDDDLDMEDDEDDDESEDDDEIDIRALVGKGKAKRAKEEKSSVSPPPKVRRT